MTTETPTTIEYRKPADIIAELSSASAANDSKRVRELTRELLEVGNKEAQREVDERNARKNSILAPVRDRFASLVQRDENLLGFVKECGGILSFSYSLPADGSTDGPVISIDAGAARTSTARVSTPRAAGNGGGGGRGKTYIVNGERLSLAGAFEKLATEADHAKVTERQASAQTDKSKQSAKWAVMSNLMDKAAEDGRVTIEA